MSRFLMLVGLFVLLSSVAFAEGPPVDMIPHNPPSRMRSIEEIRREAGLVGFNLERESSKKKRHSKRVAKKSGTKVAKKSGAKWAKKSASKVAKKAKPSKARKASLLSPRAER